MEAPIPSVVGIKKHFGGIVAIKGLSFDVQAGEAAPINNPPGGALAIFLRRDW